MPSFLPRALTGGCALAFTLVAASVANAEAPPVHAEQASASFAYVIPQPHAAPGAPSADVPEGARPTQGSVFVDVAVVTQAPFMVGGQATLEVPTFLLQAEAGVMPAAYVGAVASVVSMAGGAEAAAAVPLIQGGLDGAVVAGFSAGVHPLKDHGLEITGGYTFISVDGSANVADALPALGVAPPPSAAGSVATLHSTLHNVKASIGWRWVVADHFVLRTSLGYLQTLSSSSRVELTGPAAADPTVAAYVARANPTVDKTLNDAFTRYVKAPFASVSLGARF